MGKSPLLGLILREPMRWVTGEEGPEIRAKEDYGPVRTFVAAIV